MAAAMAGPGAMSVASRRPSLIKVICRSMVLPTGTGTFIESGSFTRMLMTRVPGGGSCAVAGAAPAMANRIGTSARRNDMLCSGR